ncbi:MAG: hypothetical protein LBO08_02870, partial [Rickettsiales bacterium]|nr:hypothetical protein [Rickettsiales bacterium]
RAIQNPQYSSITTDQWNIGTGDMLSSRVSATTKIVLPNGSAGGVINTNNTTVLFDQWQYTGNNKLSVKPISIQSLPINNPLYSMDGILQKWNYDAALNIVVFENNIVWTGSLTRDILTEIYGTPDWQISGKLTNTSNLSGSDLSVACNTNNGVVKRLFEVLNIKILNEKFSDRGAEYGGYHMTSLTEFGKTFMWITRNQFNAQFPGAPVK